MSSTSYALQLFLLSHLFLGLPSNHASLDVDIGIGIGIGGGGSKPPLPSPSPECPPPPPPEPQPCDFVNLKQYLAYKVIQRFKKTITCDPNNVTATWIGNRPCTYMGFYCETPPGLKDTPTIASISFNRFGLGAPTIEGFIDQLPDLALFHANSNNFSGTVPNLTNLTFLYELDLSNNKLLGPFPSTLLQLNQLFFLDIRFNLFAGSIPGNIFGLGLDVLFLNNNGFSQALPADLGRTPVLYLTLANNKFTGPIPASICNTSETLIEVLFLNNQLSGCLPFEVGLLRRATVFDAGFNKITGPIPWSLGCLKKVEQLNLAGNLLYGHVPDVVCKLARFGNLVNLSLSYNYFTSVGYSCRELIKSKVLDVRMNCIIGLPDQRPPWDCARFFLRPKYCPYIILMPCEIQHLGEGEEAKGNSLVAARQPGPGPSESVTYEALHKRHG